MFRTSFHWKHRRKSPFESKSFVRNVLKLESLGQFEAIAIAFGISWITWRFFFHCFAGKWKLSKGPVRVRGWRFGGLRNCHLSSWLLNSMGDFTRVTHILSWRYTDPKSLYDQKSKSSFFKIYFISSSFKLQTYAPKDGKMGIKADIHLWIGKTSSQVRRSRNSFLKNENQQ